MPNLVEVTTWTRQLVAVRAFRRVAEALEAAGVRVLPVKGIVTARRFYADVAMRPMSDIDLRVVPRSFGRTVRIARALGWGPKTHGPRLVEAELRVEGWAVEIECTLGPPGLCALGVEDV